MKKEHKHTFLWVIGSMAMMAAGFILMPKIIKKVSARLYKYGSGEIVIYADKPELVKKSAMQGEA